MATPHVSGTAGTDLVCLSQKQRSRKYETAILGSTVPLAGGTQVLSTGGRLNAAAAIAADVFAPAARLVAKQNIVASGGSSTEFTVEFSHRSGINTNTIDNDDLIVTRQWGPADQITPTLKPGSVSINGSMVLATYIVSAPGGNWDPLDFGDYRISTAAGKVAASTGNETIESRDIGSFNVRVVSPSVMYVDTFADSPGENSLRDAIVTANAAAAPRTIILDTGTFAIDVNHVSDPTSTFPQPSAVSSCGPAVHNTGWSERNDR